MELEVNIEDLLNKSKIESDRIEFKAGWNPDDRRAMRIRIPIHPVFLEKADKDSSAENACNN